MQAAEGKGARKRKNKRQRRRRRQLQPPCSTAAESHRAAPARVAAMFRSGLTVDVTPLFLQFRRRHHGRTVPGRRGDQPVGLGDTVRRAIEAQRCNGDQVVALEFDLPHRSGSKKRQADAKVSHLGSACLALATRLTPNPPLGPPGRGQIRGRHHRPDREGGNRVHPPAVGHRCRRHPEGAVVGSPTPNPLPAHPPPSSAVSAPAQPPHPQHALMRPCTPAHSRHGMPSHPPLHRPGIGLGACWSGRVGGDVPLPFGSRLFRRVACDTSHTVHLPRSARTGATTHPHMRQLCPTCSHVGSLGSSPPPTHSNACRAHPSPKPFQTRLQQTLRKQWPCGVLLPRIPRSRQRPGQPKCCASTRQPRQGRRPRRGPWRSRRWPA